MKRLLLLIMIMFISNLLTAQVNTENFRKQDLQNGFYNKLKLDFGFYSGNSDFYKLKTEFRTDYVTPNYYTFAVIQYQRGIQNEKTFINKGFIHIRTIRKLNRLFDIEFFGQKEFNDFILLKDRNLVGGGLRTSLLFKKTKSNKSFRFHIGSGLMWENEEINTLPIAETNIVRSTNYISILWEIDKRLDLELVNYHQFDLQHINDYRILLESSIAFHITKSFIFRTSVNYRFDNEPPTTIKKYDIDLTNGVSLSF